MDLNGPESMRKYEIVPADFPLGKLGLRVILLNLGRFTVLRYSTTQAELIIRNTELGYQ